MNYTIQYLTDVNGNNYVGINVPKEDIEKYLQYCFNNIENFEEYNKKLLIRNHNTYHITIFNVVDYNKNKTAIDEKIIGTNIKCEFCGIGSLSDDKTNNTTYYVVVDADIINFIRSLYNLSNITPHVTIGFIHKDIIKNTKNVCNVFFN